MRIEAASLATLKTELRTPWPTSEGPVSTRESAFLLLHGGPPGAAGGDAAGGPGRAAVGESAPLPGFGLESFASSVAALRLAAKHLVGIAEGDLEEAMRGLSGLAPVAAAPAARHAIDLALHDLLALHRGVSVARLLGGPAALADVPANATLPRLPAAKIGPLAASLIRRGATTVKLKVGGAPLAEDLDRVRALRSAGGPILRIRIDANQAWSEAEAIAALRAMAPFRIEFAEQPVQAENVRGLARVRAACGVPIAADEAVRSLEGARQIAAERAADVLIVKPMALGGLLPARAVADFARRQGLGVVVTAFLETVVGRTGAAHLAASLGPNPYAHGVAAPWDHPHDLDPPVEPTALGSVRISEEPGLGLNAGEALARRGIPIMTIERLKPE